MHVCDYNTFCLLTKKKKKLSVQCTHKMISELTEGEGSIWTFLKI